jgi:hypothetical protein
MFKVAGTVTEARLLDKATFIPPVGAKVESWTSQMLVLPPVTVDGSQANAVMLGRLPLPPLPLPLLPLPLPLLPVPLPLPPLPLPLLDAGAAPTVIEPEVADNATGSPDGDDPATPPSVT